jgi:hypothetical protein
MCPFVADSGHWWRDRTFSEPGLGASPHEGTGQPILERHSEINNRQQGQNDREEIGEGA